MARKPTGKPVGAPKKEINWELFEQLCGVQCTQSEICSMIKCDEKTLRKACLEHYEGQDYSLVYKKFSESGKCSLRRFQFVQAKTKPNMAIFLGKNWLGQTDGREDKTPPNDQANERELEYVKQIGKLYARIQELESDHHGEKADPQHLRSQ